MKYLALAVLLALMQASPPVPRKAANPSDRASQKVKSESDSNKAPSQQPPPIVEPISAQPDQHASHGPANDDTHKPIIIRELPPVSITKDRLDKLYIFFTGVLIVIGGLGVRAAYKTLKAIEKQAGIMQGQLTAMQQQATKLDESIEVARDAAEAAKTSADAAMKNIDIIKSKERARIRVVVDPWIPVVGLNGIAYTVYLDGPTPAYIVNSLAAAYTGESTDFLLSVNIPGDVILPASPTIMQKALVFPDVFFKQSHINDIGAGRSIVHFRGHIKYQDIFGDDHATEFGYKWKVNLLSGPYESGKPCLGSWETEHNRNT